MFELPKAGIANILHFKDWSQIVYSII